MAPRGPPERGSPARSWDDEESGGPRVHCDRSSGRECRFKKTSLKSCPTILVGLRRSKRRLSGFVPRLGRWPCASTITTRLQFPDTVPNRSLISRCQSPHFSQLRRTANGFGTSDTFTFLILTTHSVHSSTGRSSGLTVTTFTSSKEAVLKNGGHWRFAITSATIPTRLANTNASSKTWPCNSRRPIANPVTRTAVQRLTSSRGLLP